MDPLRLEALIADVPDFPEPGIVFKDITPLLADAAALGDAITAMAAPWRASDVDVVVGMEARGFLLGVGVAQELGVGFAPLRKAGKLPRATLEESYGLEYGSDVLEMHVDAVATGQGVVVIDDVLATGGTAAAAHRLIERAGGRVAGFGFLLELGFLNGRRQIADQRIDVLLEVGA